jgi:hypothetical protein
MAILDKRLGISHGNMFGSSYTYDHNRHIYLDDEGNEVSFNEVLYSYILPNAVSTEIWTGSTTNHKIYFRGFTFINGKSWYTEDGIEAFKKILNGGPVGNSFFGLPIKFLPETCFYSQYKNGTIETRKSTYLEALKGQKFALTTLRHEYGHYLVEKNYGKFYASYVGVISSISYSIFVESKIEDGRGFYQNCRTEVQANTLAFFYFSSPADWDNVNYPIDFKYTNSR